jgi:hypothetical protein
MSTRNLSPFTFVVVAEFICGLSILDSMTQSAEAVVITIAEAARKVRRTFMAASFARGKHGAK